MPGPQTAKNTSVSHNALWVWAVTIAVSGLLSVSTMFIPSPLYNELDMYGYREIGSKQGYGVPFVARTVDTVHIDPCGPLEDSVACGFLGDGRSEDKLPYSESTIEYVWSGILLNVISWFVLSASIAGMAKYFLARRAL